MTAPSYRLSLTRRAEKDLEDLRRWEERVLRRLLVLEVDPWAGHTLAGALSGARALELSLPGGAYRAAYVVREESRVCLVFMVGPHEGFYEQAARRAEGLRRTGKL